MVIRLIKSLNFTTLNFKLFFFLAAVCLLTASFAQPNQPKLIVGIVVDQMRADYITKYWSKFGNDGFKKLVNNGYLCKNTHYNYVPTFTGPGHASIYTGTTPCGHGIIANNWYNKESHSVIYCTDDKNAKSVGGDAKAGAMSPENMLATTIGDQLRISSRFESRVFGVALKDRGAILPAGHSANAAYWYDGNTGNWITSTYYMDALPFWVDDFNKKGLPAKYMENTWNTLLPIAQYTESIADDNTYEEPFSGLTKATFPYQLRDLLKANGNLNLIRSTPWGNTLTTDFAMALVKSENLGKGNAADMLTLSYSSTDYIGHRFGPTSVELEDTYLRLDNELARLLTFLDQWVGSKNYTLFLTADHGVSENVSYLQKHKIPAGLLNESDIEKALKPFLKKTFDDSLVLSVSNQQVFLNIPAQSVNRQIIYNVVKSFLLSLPGVSGLYDESQINAWGKAEDIKQSIENGFNQKRSGDIVIDYLPNWMPGEGKGGTTHGTFYNYDTHVPLIWYGWNINVKGSTTEPVNITDIVPTLAYLLNIPAPASSKGKLISSLVK